MVSTVQFTITACLSYQQVLSHPWVIRSLQDVVLLNGTVPKFFQIHQECMETSTRCIFIHSSQVPVNEQQKKYIHSGIVSVYMC